MSDLSSVVRPRSHPVLVPFQTAGGERHVWATFSEDQIDLDFSLHLGERIFGFWRQSPRRDQSFAVHNLSPRRQSLHLSSLNLVATDDWVDLIGGEPVGDLHGKLSLAPYQSLWITNRPSA